MNLQEKEEQPKEVLLAQINSKLLGKTIKTK